MELRVLQYFLAVTREQNISAAAEVLHLSQPTLSRQLREMEEELGKQLFVRGSRKITLTDDGMILRKRAEEILSLVRKTEQEITASNSTVAGSVLIGAGETDAMRLLARTAQNVQAEYPDIRFAISSGDSTDITEQLDKGLLDFGLLFDPIDTQKYDSLPVPVQDTWGILARRDSPLAQKGAVCAEDLQGVPLLVSRNISQRNTLLNWMKRPLAELNVVVTYNLVFNASLMVDEGMGYALTLDKLINVTGSNLCFLPLTPAVKADMHLVWKRYQLFSKPAEIFLAQLREAFAAEG